MKAITLHQFWASLMALCLKKIETRGWYTSYRGELAIHAAASVPSYARFSFMDTPEAQRALAPLGITKPDQLDELPRGVIVGVVDLVGCIPTNDPGRADEVTGRVFTPPGLLSDEYAFGNYYPDRFMWVTENLRPLETASHTWSGGNIKIISELHKHDCVICRATFTCPKVKHWLQEPWDLVCDECGRLHHAGRLKVRQMRKKLGVGN